MKLYIIAGERSGDLHGSNLAKALLARDPSLSLRGFGGDEMKKAGVDVIVHYERMAFMGFTAVIANLSTISKLIKQCKQDILEFNPDAIILIDYAGFNMRIAKFAKLHGLKVFYYISPKVWAWYTKRAWNLKASVDRLFSILPFEKDFFKKFDWEIDYVGNPVLDAIKVFKPDPDFLQKNNLVTDKQIVALLPGSRKLELKRMIPVMAEVVKMNPQYQFVVAAVDSLPGDLYRPLKEIPSVKFVYESTYDLLTHARAAIVTSGTATLETSIFKVPQAVIYKAGALEYVLLKQLVKIPFISLTNLIVNRLVFKEFIQNEMNAENLNAELKELVNDTSTRKKMLEDYDEVYRILDTGSASDNAAKLMLEALK